MNPVISENLRFLLWQEKIPNAKWVTHLAGWLGCKKYHAETILKTGELSSEEQKIIESKLGISEEELAYSSFLENSKIDILETNIVFLLDDLDTTQKEMAAKIGVSANTISRWYKREFMPDSKKLKDILRFFGLPESIDLKKDPLFLSIEPVPLNSRKKWLHQRVDKMSAETLRDLYPALKRLLEDDE